MNSLVAVGTSAAYGYSLVATFMPSLLPAGTVNVYYEAAAVIVTLILLGRMLEARARGRSSQAIQQLITLQPRTAWVLKDDQQQEIPVSDVRLVLMSGHLTDVPHAIALSRATIRNIQQNLFWAFAYNAALIPVAAGVLYSINGVLLSPIFAAGAMALSSVFVLTNALRLRRFQL